MENLRQAVFPNYLTCTCVNDAYSDFIFAEATNLIPSERRPTQNLGLTTKLYQQYNTGQAIKSKYRIDYEK